MKSNIILALLVILASVQSALAQQWATKMFKTTSHDFGSVARGAKVEFAFEVTNQYEEDIHIAGVRTSCGCTTPSITKDTLKTWEKGAILAKYNTTSFLGSKSATITVTIDKPYYAEVQLTVHGFIRSDVVFDPGAVDFGTVDEGTPGAQKISLNYAGRSDWKIVDIRSANPNLAVEIADVRRASGRVSYDLTVRLKPEAPAGYLQDELMIVSDDQQLQTIPLAVEGRIISPLTVSPANLYLGELRPGESVTKQLVIRGKGPFKIVEIECQDDCFEFTKSDEAKKLHFVPVKFTAGAKPGTVSETIHIKTDLGSGASTSVVVTGEIKAVQNETALRP